MQITIIGTGLIGGSFALAARAAGFTGRIVGSDRAEVLERAQAMGAVDACYTQALEACRGSQLVMLATPVGAIVDLLEKLGPMLPPDVLITDVGSTKAEIVARARSVFGVAAGERFLGGHPMAGKEHSGVEHASADLFRGAAWILTPEAPPSSSQSGARSLPPVGGTVANEFFTLLEKIGARVMIMEAAAQDRLCAWVSHLPQMISAALAATLMDEFEPNGGLDNVNAVGGRALREMTRIAASPYSMWRDIALTNTTQIEQALQQLEQRLAHLRENLRTPELRAEFERANGFAAGRKKAGTE